MLINKTLFKNKYLIKSIRLKNFDYTSNNLYFITICTDKRCCYFGNIINKNIKLNWCGLILKNEILKTTRTRTNIKIHEYCIMPNHIHILLQINNDHINNNPTGINNDPVGARLIWHLRSRNNELLSLFVGLFKAGVFQTN